MSDIARPWTKHLPENIDPRFVPPVDTINNMMAQAFDRYSDQLMLEYYGETYTYAQMRDQVAEVSTALRQREIGKGDVVALYLPNSPWHPIWFLGVLMAGATVSHFSPLDAERELEHKIHDCGAKIVVSLSTPYFTEKLIALQTKGVLPECVLCHDPISTGGKRVTAPKGTITHEDFVEQTRGAAFEPAKVQADDIALLQYTGGTTGVPKAAILTHGNLSAAVSMYSEWSKNDAAAQPGASVLLYSPLFHIMGLVTVLLKRTHEGGAMHLRQRFDAADAINEIEKFGINSLSGVPTIWIAITQLPDIASRDLSSLTYVGSGGAPLPVEVYSRVKTLTGMKLRGGWGMTETSPAGTNVPADMPDNKLGTIGIPLPGVDLKIVSIDDPTKVMAIGESGEMAVRGPNVTRGYWNRTDETTTAFIEGGWFLTGDIGYMDEDGYFYIVDRKKDMILSGGFNVYPLVIENAVHEHPSVSEVVVIGVPDPYRGESAKAFCVLADGAKPFDIKELREFLEDKLGRHELPQFLEFRSELPRTPVGKYSRKDLVAEEKAKAAASAT